MNYPLEVWPRRNILFPSGNSTLALPNPIFRPAFEGASSREVFVRDVNNPAPLALLANDATQVTSREFCTLNGEGFYGDFADESLV